MRESTELLTKNIRYARVDCNGSVMIYDLGYFTTNCVIDASRFPYDQQQCIVRYSPWSHPRDEIRLTTVGNAPNRQNFVVCDYLSFCCKCVITQFIFQGNSEWQIVNLSTTNEQFSINGFVYDCVDYYVLFRRNAVYYVAVLITPTFIIATICIVGIFTPDNTGTNRKDKVLYIYSVSQFSTVCSYVYDSC